MKLGMMARNLILVATMFVVFSATYGCKQPSDNERGSETTEITVTVKKDVNVEEAPKNFKLKKGSELGLTALKERMKGLRFKDTYVLGKICLENESGKEITDTSKYKFDKDTTIFIVSKPSSVNVEPKLTYLKVDGFSKDIADTMEFGKTKKEKVKVEVKVSPTDAEVIYGSAFEGGSWNLKLGQNTLNITVKKGLASKVYTLNIERVDSETPILKKLTVGAKVKEGAEINSVMKFKISEDEVSVVAETDPAGAKTTFVPDLPGGRLRLEPGKGGATLKITVGEGSNKSEYTVEVIREFIDVFEILAGNKQGEKSKLSEEDKNKILKGEGDVTVKLLGPNAFLTLASRERTWSSVKINGKKELHNAAPGLGYASVSIIDLTFPDKGKTMDVEIKIEVGEFSEELNFKIERLDETVDVPVDTLIIGDRNVTGGQQGTSLKALADGSKPVFESGDPAHIEIQCPDSLESVTIDGNNCQVNVRQDSSGQDIYYANYNVAGLNPSGKDITIVMVPSDTDDYHALTWTFRLEYKNPPRIGVGYEINGKNRYSLDNNFVTGLEKGTNPSISIDGKYLNLKLILAPETKTVEINGNNVPLTEDTNILLYSIPLSTSEEQIEITVTPNNTGIYSPNVLRFRATGTTAKETLKPTFSKISGDENLPKTTFLDRLADNSKPEYQVFGNSADLVISMDQYNYEFLCQEVKINGDIVKVKEVQDLFGNVYEITKDIPVLADSFTDVRIEFIAKADIADDLIWEFKVKGGGNKPKLPQSSVKIFKINGIGTDFNPLPKSLTDHLIDETNPLYEFDGKKAYVEIGAHDNQAIEKIVFKQDGNVKASVLPQPINFSYIAGYEFVFADTNEHDIELVIYPKKGIIINSQGELSISPKKKYEYSELTYKFKLKSSGKNPLLPVSFGVNTEIRKSGYTATLNAETASLLVQSTEDVMLEVKIGEKGVDEEDCFIRQSINSQGNPFWESRREVSLPIDGTEKTFVIRVKPRDTLAYRETVCEYKLKGTALPNNNAEFIYRSYGPKVDSTIEWKPGFENNDYDNDYGSMAVTLKAYTVSPRANVKYIFVDRDGKPINGENESTMVNNGNGVHTSAKITLFSDKPTIIKAWVVAEDGVTTDDKKGVWKYTYNPIPLSWGYEDKSAGGDYKTEAYDLIEIEASKVTDNKVYLIFAPWKESIGYIVDNTDLPTHQTEFVKLGKVGDNQEYYKTSIDVSSLLNNSITELNALLKMKYKGKDCFTYNVKIKVKS